MKQVTAIEDNERFSLIKGNKYEVKYDSYSDRDGDSYIGIINENGNSVNVDVKRFVECEELIQTATQFTY